MISRHSNVHALTYRAVRVVWLRWLCIHGVWYDTMDRECSTRTTITQRSNKAKPLQQKRCENTKMEKWVGSPELMALMGYAPLQRLACCPVGAGQQENEKVKSARHRGTQYGRKEQRGQAEQRSCRWKRFIKFDWKTFVGGSLWILRGCCLKNFWGMW